jgi:NAD+ synthase
MNASEKVNFISNWIKDYANNMPSKAQSLVIGISGGIDSSVSSYFKCNDWFKNNCVIHAN